MYWQIPLRIDHNLSDLRPIEVLPHVNMPVFTIGGTLDEHTKVEETERMYDALPDQKALWLVEGASHEDIFAYDSHQYQRRILQFIKDYM